MPESTSARLTRAQFARQERVAKSTVTRWIQDGRISLGPDGRIDPVQGRAERLATESPLPKHQARKAQFDLLKGLDDQPPDLEGPTAPAERSVTPVAAPTPSNPSAEIGAALKFETYRLQRAKAELANLEIDKAAGLLVERAEIDFILADFAAVVRDQLESLPDRLTPDLAACRSDPAKLHRSLGEATRGALENILTHLDRRLGALV